MIFVPSPATEWTGEYQEVEVTDWWCPTIRQWVYCDEACPDGTPHRVKRTRTTRAKVLRLVGGNDDD